MSFKTIDLYVVQAPGFPGQFGANRQNPDDFLWNMLGALPDSVPVKDVQNFINRVHVEFFSRQRPIRNLVIAGHGSGELLDLSAYGEPGKVLEEGHFNIGTSRFSADFDRDKSGTDRTLEYIHKLIALRPVFAPDAHVFLLTCKVGTCQRLLRLVAQAVGVPVHAYTNYVTATDYLLFKTANDETDDDNTEVICWQNECKTIAPGEERNRTWEPR
jgi:hypothetical protein